MRITYFELINEVKEAYTRLRREGISRVDSVQTLQEQYHDELTIGAEDDGILFWIGLADAQYALKELSLDVANMGQTSLEQLASCVPELARVDVQKRNERYACAPMPERDHIPTPKHFRCQWKIGDTFAYRLKGPDAERYGFANDYVVIRKVDELEEDGWLWPVVTITHWTDANLPLTEADFQKVPLLKLSSGPMFSTKGRYEYRLEILFSNRKQIEQLDMQYLGNFKNVPMPKDEFYCRVPGKVLMVSPKNINNRMSYFCSLKTYFENEAH